MSKALAEISVDGLPAWGIEPITLPVTFGRFARDIALTFANIDRTKGHKHDYMYECQTLPSKIAKMELQPLMTISSLKLQTLEVISLIFYEKCYIFSLIILQ